VEQDNLA